MRELQLLQEYLQRRQRQHNEKALKLLCDAQNVSAEISARLGKEIGFVLEEIRALDADTGEFVKSRLQEKP